MCTTGTALQAPCCLAVKMKIFYFQMVVCCATGFTLGIAQCKFRSQKSTSDVKA